MGFWDDVKDGIGRMANPIGNDHDTAPWWDPGGQLLANPGAAAEKKRKEMLYQQSAASGQFADRSEGSFGQLGARGGGALDLLQAQAQGQNSVSQEQLRQSLGQQLAQQRSLAASASPRNSAMAARTAAIQSGRLSSGLAGQQAVAGLAERNQAQQHYGALLGQLRGQDLNAALGGRLTAVQGYGAANAGTPEKSKAEEIGPIIGGVLGAIASDRRLKSDLKPGDSAANTAIAKLQPYTYDYKDPAKYGEGKQLGTTTQDLARAGLGQAVVRTRDGEVVDAGKLTGANTAMIAALGRRVAELEGSGADPQAAAAQAQLNARRAYLTGSRREVQLEQLDPRSVEAQAQLDARRAALQRMAAGAR